MDPIVEILGGFDRGLIFDEFLSSPQNEQIWKNEAEVWKERFSGKGRRQRRGPRSAFGVCKSIRIRQSLQQHFRRPVPSEQGAADLKATACAVDPYENSCWWSLYCMLVLRVLWLLCMDRWIDRYVSMTRTAYDASFAKLVSFVAYRGSRRSEDQRILRILFHWLARFVF